MPNERPDGGPAFPGKAFCASGFYDAPGMTLRDYFAGKALAEILEGNSSNDYLVEQIARAAYIYADAMLAAREAR